MTDFPLLSSTSGSYFFKGRVALLAILQGLDVGERDFVLVPGFTCFVVPRAVVLSGAQPFYVDIDADTYNCPLEAYRGAYLYARQARPDLQPKAIIIQHTYGNPNRETKAIVAWAREHNLKVIEDCAHVMGEVFEDRHLGTFGDAAFFSGQWSKPLVSGLGGVAFAGDSELAARLKSLEAKAPPPSLAKQLMLLAQLFLFTFVFGSSLYWWCLNVFRWATRRGLVLGSSSRTEMTGGAEEQLLLRMGAIQRLVFRWKLRDTEKVVLARRRRTKAIATLARDFPLRTITWEDSLGLLRFPFRVAKRSDLMGWAQVHRIPLGDWFNHPLHPEEACRDGLSWTPEKCPEAVRAAAEVVNIPINGKDWPSLEAIRQLFVQAARIEG